MFRGASRRPDVWPQAVTAVSITRYTIAPRLARHLAATSVDGPGLRRRRYASCTPSRPFSMPIQPERDQGAMYLNERAHLTSDARGG